ncbi:protein-tyrosine kinase [Knoellia sinensis KCTC 19936]|uniref:Protein-tyrosine kinase n=1 Tax=Knoellia sinensis KCTC 19936 TaxID=1385520 RepID=A0A0A0JGH0_9MICO|nr:polysaccharide biosynthesis tyrosine autokinase [Knoellia sinensis]KGN34711.1 protein-tyrosine kinase [Knoellia sinensis KCTC 19936]
MTLQDYIRIIRQRWIVIVICAAVAGLVTWFLTPANASSVKDAPSYTATATVLVSAATADEQVSVDRVVLYAKTGAIPTAAAKALEFEGDPAILASQVTITSDPSGAALTIAASDRDGAKAAETANAFAKQTVAFFAKPRPGVGRAVVTILQEATPIPDEIGGGFVVPPSRPLRAALAALVGLLLGFALALVLQRVDSRLRTRDEVHAGLRLPIIAEVPRLKRSQKGERTITVAVDPLSPYSDAYRAARTALMHTVSRQAPGEYMGRRAARPEPRPVVEGARLILVTSGNAAEGKTTTVANLAASFAETGQRVLVLDADLRSPNTHTLFDVPQGAGISDYISDNEDTPLEALIRPTNVPAVRIITAGTRLTHPASLASRMGHLLAEVRELADVVIIDSAPLLAASDVFDILPIVDTVVLVVRSGRLTDVAARRVAELLGRFQVPISGVVLVGARGRRADGYGHSYGYGDTARPQRDSPSPKMELDPRQQPSAPSVAVPQHASAPEVDRWSLPPRVDDPQDAAPSRRSRHSSH